jgi:translin
LEEIRRSVKEMESHFADQLGRRDRVLKDSRDIITSSSRAIISVHTGKIKEAEKQLSDARSKLRALKKSAGGSVARYLISPEAEFVEASAVIALVKDRPVPSLESLGASPEAYMLGLLDTVGELKRLVLDSIMHRKLAKARRYFETMEELYSGLSPLAVYDHVVNGARRKIDVARMLVEDTRGLITEETRRESVNSSMSRLERKLDARGRP